MAHTGVAFIRLPILELWEELQVFWQVTVVGTWLEGNVDNSDDFWVGGSSGIMIFTLTFQ